MTSPNPPTMPPSGQLPPVFFPPPAYYPMPMPMPMPMPRQGGGFARAIFTTLAVTILGFSLTLNLYLIIAAGVMSGGTDELTQRKVLVEGDATKLIAVVPVKGVIWDSTVEDMRIVLDAVRKDSNVKAIVLEVDSPGGTVTASDEIYTKLLKLKADKGVPLVISMQGMAASGGYYISCAGDKIIAQPTTTTGSIGVLWGGLNVSKLLKSYGVEDNTLTSREATYKLSGSPYREDTDEGKAYRQAIIDSQHAMFKQIVTSTRKLDPKNADAVANGKVFLGPDALKLKLVDSIGYLSDAVAAAETLAGVTGAQVERIERQVGFLESLSGRSEGRTVQVKIGEASFGVDERALEHLLAPRPMFIFGEAR